MHRPPIRPRALIMVPLPLLSTVLLWLTHTRNTLIIKLQGRLGNQLFQIAASEYYASQYWTRPSVVFLRNNYSEETDLSQRLFQDLPHVDQPPCHATTFVEKRHSCETVKPFGHCALLHGFWQCPFYAQAGRQLVERILKTSQGYQEAVSKIHSMLNSTEHVVVVHVRRGDYTKGFNKGLLEPLPTSYYQQAAKRMPSPATFMIFSDDPEWCRSYMTAVLDRGGDRVVVVDEKDNVKALVMMMRARHFIIANSTFSWWAAFLAGRGIVVAPLKWFGERVTGGQKIRPPEWIVI